MQDKKNGIVDWIHLVEWEACDNDDTKFKRIHGIVTELCFEKVISKSIGSSDTTNLVSGWCYKSDLKTRYRDWFILWRDLTPTSNENSRYPNISKEINRKFAKSLLRSRPNDKIFAVSYQIEESSWNKGILSLSWTISEVELNNNDIKTSPRQQRAKEYQTSITKSINIRLEKVSSSAELRIDNFLNRLSEEELRKILCTRCFMNFSGFYLSDIDGIGIDHENNGFILEFKRKNPAKGPVFSLSIPERSSPTIQDYNSEIDGFRKMSELEIKSVLDDPTRFKKIYDQSGFFGLDSSHYLNVEVCREILFNYRYIIWNSSKSNSSELVNFDFSPKYKPEIKERQVFHTSFDGLSTTKPEDSGTYFRKRRYQLMINASSFHELIYRQNF
ncbi:MAG: hypothetical protein V4801_32560 [Burkholderia gladioli]